MFWKCYHCDRENKTYSCHLICRLAIEFAKCLMTYRITIVIFWTEKHIRTNTTDTPQQQNRNLQLHAFIGFICYMSSTNRISCRGYSSSSNIIVVKVNIQYCSHTNIVRYCVIVHGGLLPASVDGFRLLNVKVCQIPQKWMTNQPRSINVWNIGTKCHHCIQYTRFHHMIMISLC